MTLEETLNKIGIRVAEAAKQNLKKKIYPYGKKGKKGDKIASGNLYRSIKSKVTATGNGMFIMEVTMLPYGWIVDTGRAKGTYPPIGPIKKWMKSRNINSSYSYAIVKSIKENGIRPTHFMENAYATEKENEDKAIEDFVQTQLIF